MIKLILICFFILNLTACSQKPVDRVEKLYRWTQDNCDPSTVVMTYDTDGKLSVTCSFKEKMSPIN